MSQAPARAKEDLGWNVVVGRRRRAAAAARDSNGAIETSKNEKKEEVEEDGKEEEEEDTPPPRPSRPSSAARVPLPRPHSRVIADLVASVRECEREVSRSKAWRSLMARLDESEEDFFAEEEEEEEEGRRGGDETVPSSSSSPSSSFSFGNVSRLTVLGLGSLESSRTPRLQAALALLLARERFPKVVSGEALRGSSGSSSKSEEEEKEKKKKNEIRLFAADPVFTAADREALEELGFCVMAPEEAVEAGRARRRKGEKEQQEENEDERNDNDSDDDDDDDDDDEDDDDDDDDDELSFFYLPHCYPPVAEEVLRAHWNRRDISRMAILGNPLSSVAEKTARSTEKGKGSSSSPSTTPRCLAAGSSSSSPSSSSPSSRPIIEASVVGPELDAASARSGLGAAFNDTALHLFPRWTEGFAKI